MIRFFLTFILSIFVLVTNAKTVTVALNRVSDSGLGASIGYVTLTDTKYGMLIRPNLHGLPPGVHGFHIHMYPDCGNGAQSAGGHFDPERTKKHLGPYNSGGHLGDLPELIVGKDGSASLPVLAPRLTVREVIGHSLIIHAGGDNYSDFPKKLGGGGPRIACGVIR